MIQPKPAQIRLLCRLWVLVGRTDAFGTRTIGQKKPGQGRAKSRAWLDLLGKLFLKVTNLAKNRLSSKAGDWHAFFGASLKPADRSGHPYE